MLFMIKVPNHGNKLVVTVIVLLIKIMEDFLLIIILKLKSYYM